MTYRFYVADSLFYSAQGKMLTRRLSDILYSKEEDQRSGEEIVMSVVKGAGLKFTGGGE